MDSFGPGALRWQWGGQDNEVPDNPLAGADPGQRDASAGPAASSLGNQQTTPPADPSADGSWLLVEEGFTPEREREIESLFTVANGQVGTRGSLQEGSLLSEPATFIAGLFSHPPHSEPELAVVPDWAQLKVYVEGEPLRLDRGETLEHRRQLDMRRGVLEREWRHRDVMGRITSLHFARFASLADRSALLEKVEVVPENYSGRVCVESMIDGRSASVDDARRLEMTRTAAHAAEPGGPEGAQTRATLILTARTVESGLALAFASASILQSDDPVVASHDIVSVADAIGERWEWDAQIGVRYRVCKLVTIATSRDSPNPERSAREHLARLLEVGVEEIEREHEKAWAERWEVADVRLPGDEEDQRAARFAVYHLIKSANPDDERVSIGARALTGESYKGHVFWDTEIYMLPFFVFTHPPSARALLMYRYHTLPAAREKARSMGYRGALYPWESADTGEEVAPSHALAPDGEIIPILTADLEQHISADIAYAVHQYWQATGDDGFLLDAGAEIILETARFWASRASLEADGLYHIRGVIGPDEYHEGVDDNAYTNVMAQWNLEQGLDLAHSLAERWPARWTALARSLSLSRSELEAWQRVAEGMYTGLDPETGLFEQFQGYFGLEEIDLSAFEPRTAPMDVILGRERTAQTQVIKQPDVLLLIYLLWDRFSPRVREANFRFYEPRCGHGSSLSPSIHALVAARLGDQDLARRYYRQSAEIDLANNMGNAAGGIHSAAQGGLWQALVFGFGGLRLRDDGLGIDPKPLPQWGSLGFPVQWRGRLLRVTASASQPTVRARLERGEPMAVTLGEGDRVKVIMQPGKLYAASRRDHEWQPWQEKT